MTATGGFPAPGPQDREPAPRQSPSGLPPNTPPPSGHPVQPPGYQPQAPMRAIPMLTAHKPGIVALRPLQVGDILDGAVQSVRFNPKSMVGLSAIVLALFLVPSAVLGVGATHLTATTLSKFGPGAEAFLGYPALLLQDLSTTFATAILSGLLVYVVGQAVLGRKPDISATWQATRARVWSLLALMLLSALVTIGAAVVLIGPGVLLLINNNLGAGVILIFLGLLGYIGVLLWFSTKISLAAPAIVLEGHGVFAGLRRSFTLTKGAFWRVLGITLLAGLLAYVTRVLLGLPFSLIGVAVAMLAGQGSESGQMITTFVSHLSGLVTGAITIPFVAAVTGLLYIDRRMRLEALDVVLLREAQANPAPRI
jgi:hypothetical protein